MGATSPPTRPRTAASPSSSATSSPTTLTLTPCPRHSPRTASLSLRRPKNDHPPFFLFNLDPPVLSSHRLFSRLLFSRASSVCIKLKDILYILYSLHNSNIIKKCPDSFDSFNDDVITRSHFKNICILEF